MRRLPDSAGRAAGRAGTQWVLLVAVLLFPFACPPRVQASFPLVMKDDRGVTVRLDKAPRRVVSLAPNLTEIVYLLGREDLLVGVTRFCNYPARAAALPRVGGIVDPDIERIVAADPDLVLCTTDGNPKERVGVLEAMGIPCFAVGPQNLAAVFRTIERVGKLLGVPGKGRREADALRARAERVSREKRTPSPRVLFVVSTSPIIAAGNGTFLDELVRIPGGRNAAGMFAGRYPRLSVEDLIAAGPDIILVAGMTGVEGFSPDVSRWAEVPAFRNGDVVTLDGDLVTRPGPRMVGALEGVAKVFSAWRERRTASPARERGSTR
ncbi:MAG: cobalamin-binding protein [Deltaproteobacteria bacterium]|nr:cobalamin-binding protein [Deltaproteobacteria bacterium]